MSQTICTGVQFAVAKLLLLANECGCLRSALRLRFKEVMEAEVGLIIDCCLIEIQQNLALLGFAKKRQFGDALLRIGQKFMQQLAVMLHHSTDGGSFEKIRVVAERTLDPIARSQEIGRQVIFFVSILRVLRRDR